MDGDGVPEFVFSSNAEVGLYQFNSISGWHRVWLLDGLQGTVVPYLVDADGDGVNEIVIATDHIPNYTKIYKLASTNIDYSENPRKFVINIFPNPANGEVTIQYASLVS